MDVDILNQARIAFFLGNYSKVLDVWQSTEQEDEYFNFVIARAVLAQKELKPIQYQFTKNPSPQLRELTDIVNTLMVPMLRPTKQNTTVEDDRKMIDGALKKVRESFDDSSKYSNILKCVCCYLSMNACEATYTLSVDVSTKDALSAEIKFLQLLTYLRGNKPDLAEKKLYELKKFDDEDVLTYLAQIYTYIYNGQPSEAQRSINEAKERFGESAKLMNLLVNALIGQNKFDEAFDLASKLQQALIEKEQFSDKSEIQTCLSNLIVLAEICGKPQVKEECIQALQTLNPSALILKTIGQKFAQFEQEFQ